MMAVLLPLPDDPRWQLLIQAWNDGSWQARISPLRSSWLSEFEHELRSFYPSASSRDLSLTARHYFPGYLAAGHDVP